MSTSDYTKFPGGSQDKGLNIFEPDIGAEINWSEATVNVSGGIRRGVGVVYGVAPLAGHSNTETPAGTATNGIMRSEIQTGSQGLIFRRLIFGVVPITMAPYDGAYPKRNKQFYLYLVGLDYPTDLISFDACLGATLDSSVNKQANTFVAGLAQSSYRQESPLVRLHKTELLNLPLTSTPNAVDMQIILEDVEQRKWLPYAHISVSGKRIPYNWMFADTTATPVPDGTTAPNMNLWSKQLSIGTNPTVLGGSPSEIITREFTDNNQRLLTVYCLDDDGYTMDIKYTKQITQVNTVSVPAYGTADNYVNLTGATKTGASTAYSSINAALINDPGSYTNSRHDAVLIAGKIPIAIIYQDWLQAVKGMMPRWVDLSNPGCNPRIGLSEADSAGFNPNGSSSSFSAYPYYAFTGANTGILQANTAYDIGFSYYNKLIDYETNVAFGVTVLVGATGNVGVIINGTLGSGENVWETMQNGVAGDPAHTPPWEYSDIAPKSTVEVGRGAHINDYELRFYYRQSGIGEWLPAGNFDASQFWFFGGWSASGSSYGPQICAGAIAGLPGGQPNGFIDYSPLPKQTYISTTVFQNRAFWWSEKSMHFSLLNNIYAYPTRNIVACPTGKWRGGIVHSQKDLSQQLSRLVVFGDQTFSCRFTGERTVQNIVISSGPAGITTGQFPIDGSDFRMEYLCDSTAFSYRSACVAEGILYWWGPQGVYKDDGVTPPDKISGILEPDIFRLIDSQLENEVHCVFNKRTGEVIWFYMPRVVDEDFPTHALAYNVENGKFYPYKFPYKIDASQNIKIEKDETPEDVAGERILLHCRATVTSTVQRTYYFDDLVLAGRQGPEREFTVLTVATPSAGTRRLTLASGSAGITANDVAVNDLICIQNAKGYAPSLVDADDMIAKITAVNNGSNYIEILLPDGASFDATASLTGQTAFPIYQQKPLAVGLHGITYLLDTNYWLPDGMSNAWNWIYLYLLFRYVGIPTPTDPFTGLPTGARISLSYRSLVCSGALTDLLKLRNNSAGHCQIHHPLRNAGRAANGQALKYSLSGIHIGNPWTLEYLEAHCKKETGFNLKEFEG